jgi:hypothetical protein
MRQRWEDYEHAAETGPLSVVLKVVIGLFVVGLFVGSIGYVLGWFTETAVVIKEEFGPRAALDKYSWFKDAAATLEKKRADITVYQSRLAALDTTYTGVSRTQWAREDREQYNVWQTEVAGVKASYNSLAAEYNAAMSKFHWQFAEAGRLPPGANDPLPREFKPYQLQ